MKIHALFLAAAIAIAAQAAPPETIPATDTPALDGHPVAFPRDLQNATVLIVGFSRNSQGTTTDWVKRVRAELSSSNIGFYDMPMLAAVPGLFRGTVLRSIRNSVPDELKPHLVPLIRDEDAWKRAAGFSKDSPDAAYVLLVDKKGCVRWKTHEPPTSEVFAQISKEARILENAKS